MLQGSWADIGVSGWFSGVGFGVERIFINPFCCLSKTVFRDSALNVTRVCWGSAVADFRVSGFEKRVLALLLYM